jgi:hypothetical protein
MVYVLRYFRDGRLLDASHWDKPLREARKIAASELVQHHADYAAIFDSSDNEKLVETVSAPVEVPATKVARPFSRK